MKLCDRCEVSGCLLNYLGTACSSAREEECPEVQPNNAEIITNMEYDELAAFLLNVSQGLLSDKKFKDIRTWLAATHKEGWV